MDIKRLFINMGILGLFVFGMMAFIITTQTSNSVNIPITNNTLINETYGDLSSSLSGSQTKSETVLGNFGNVTPTQQFGELEVKSIIPTTKIVKTITLGLWNILIKLPMVFLGVSPIVASLISSIIIMLLIIGVWAVWKGVISS